MEQQQQQRRRPRRIHRGILNGIARLSNPQRLAERHKLFVSSRGPRSPPVARHSLQYMVDFLDNVDNNSHEVRITELYLDCIKLSYPSDGGLQVLASFFSRSDTTLTKVTLNVCNFGSQEEASQLLSAFHTNRTVTDLAICYTRRVLGGAALGNSLSGLMQNMPQLQRLACQSSNFDEDCVRAMQPGLRNNQTLKQLFLSWCEIANQGIRHLADALVGNTTMQVLDISYNFITSSGLGDIMRLIESMQLKTVNFGGNEGILDDENANQQFVAKLFKNTTIQELPEIYTIAQTLLRDTISIILARNQCLNHVSLLLLPPQPQPPPPMHQQHHPQQQQQQPRYGNSSTTMMLKTCHKAITKFAMVPNNAGASAIFKLFQARPALLEKRLKRPASAADATVAVSRDAPCDNNGKNCGDDSAIVIDSSSQKRRRL